MLSRYREIRQMFDGFVKQSRMLNPQAQADCYGASKYGNEVLVYTGQCLNYLRLIFSKFIVSICACFYSQSAKYFSNV